MAALHALPAAGAMTDVDAELADNEPARELHLELLGHPSLHERVLAIWAKPFVSATHKGDRVDSS
jgi:hypothetical protein